MDSDPRPKKKYEGQVWKVSASCHELQVESPAWHREVLNERLEAVKSGKETFVDWETAKELLRHRRRGLDSR